MKINEILLESEDHIKLYWALKGIDINAYYAVYNVFISDSNTLAAKQNLLQLNSFVYELLTDDDWQYLENDPDFDSTYDKLLDLYDSIQTYLRNTK